MNIEPEMMVLLMKEVKASSMSELAKSLLMQVLGGEQGQAAKPTEVATPRIYRVVPKSQQTAAQPLQQPIVGGGYIAPAPQTSPFQSNRGAAGQHRNIDGANRRNELFPRIYAETIEKLYKHYSNTGYEITLRDMWKRYAITRPSDKFLLREYMIEMATKGKQIVVISRTAFPGYGVSHPHFDIRKAVMGGNLFANDKSPMPKAKRAYHRHKQLAIHEPTRVVAEFDKVEQPVAKEVKHKDYPFDKGDPIQKRLTRGQFMRHFRSEATKKHMKEGRDYLTATLMAMQDYNAYLVKRGISKVSHSKTKQIATPASATPQEQPAAADADADSTAGDKTDYEQVALVEFPDIKGIKMMTKAYLKDLLKKLDVGKMPCLTESMDSYVLDLPDGGWNDFMADVLVKESQIKAALQLTASKDFIIRQNKLFFE